MEQIIIQVKDLQKAQALVDFLQTLDFVEAVKSPNIFTAKKSRRAKESNFFALAGLWAGRDISLDSIRQKAWPERS